MKGFWKRWDEAIRGAGLYAVLVIAAVAIFFLAYNLGNFNLPVLVAAGVVFACLITLFIAAQRKPPEPSSKPNETTTLLTPTVVVSEVRAAALVTYGEIGTVTIKKERDKAGMPNRW